MAQINLNARSIDIRTIHNDSHNLDWETASLGFQVYEGCNAWYGRLSRKLYRKEWPRDGIQEDLSRFDELVKILSPVRKDNIYPVFPAEELTLLERPQGFDSKDIHLKAPNLHHYQGDSDVLAKRLLNEAKLHETILRKPHPHLDSYLGCVVEEGRIVRLAFRKYSKSLHDRMLETPEEFTSQQRMDCMDQVERAAKHLHSQGRAHNDISPSNIMFKDDESAVLIDLDASAPLGEKLTKGGLVTGWKGPFVGVGREFHESSAECDMLAIEAIREDLAAGLI